MKAIVITSPGEPEVLKLQDMLDPALTRDTDILVRVKAAGVNPVDTKMRAKPDAHPAPLPPVLGCDGAGIVQVVGKAVTGFKPRDEVYLQLGTASQPARQLRPIRAGGSPAGGAETETHEFHRCRRRATGIDHGMGGAARPHRDASLA